MKHIRSTPIHPHLSSPVTRFKTVNGLLLHTWKVGLRFLHAKDVLMYYIYLYIYTSRDCRHKIRFCFLCRVAKRIKTDDEKRFRFYFRPYSSSVQWPVAPISFTATIINYYHYHYCCYHYHCYYCYYSSAFLNLWYPYNLWYAKSSLIYGTWCIQNNTNHLSSICIASN